MPKNEFSPMFVLLNIEGPPPPPEKNEFPNICLLSMEGQCHEEEREKIADILENLLRIRRRKSSAAESSRTRGEGESVAAWEAREASWATSARRRSSTFETFFSDLIIYCPFIAIAEDFKCF
jgi:hypothetical protein